MEVPTLSTLLNDYATRLHLARSPLLASQLDALERELGLELPADYRDVLLAYDVRDLEVQFTRFSPPSSGRLDLPLALRESFNSQICPFTRVYVEKGVLPVGTDWTESDFVMVVRRSDEPSGGPFGSIGLFDWERDVYPDTFPFVSSTFSQALHSALFLSSIKSELVSGTFSKGQAWEGLIAIDPAIDGHDYWRRWVDYISER